jgi:hypothetical protein
VKGCQDCRLRRRFFTPVGDSPVTQAVTPIATNRSFACLTPKILSRSICETRFAETPTRRVTSRTLSPSLGAKATRSFSPITNAGRRYRKACAYYSPAATSLAPITTTPSRSRPARVEALASVSLPRPAQSEPRRRSHRAVVALSATARNRMSAAARGTQWWAGFPRPAAGAPTRSGVCAPRL